MSWHPEQPDRSESPRRDASPADALRQLEQATFPAARLSILSDSRDADSDAETAVLRESWLALSQLLDSNTPDVDETALLSQVRRRVGRQVKRRRWQGAGLALAAASLLLAVAVAWLITRSSNPPIAEKAPVQTQSESPQFVAVEPATENPSIAESDGVNFDAAYWQDDLADELAQTQHDLANIQSNWFRRPDPMAWMQFQMNDFENELGNSSL